MDSKKTGLNYFVISIAFLCASAAICYYGSQDVLLAKDNILSIKSIVDALIYSLPEIGIAETLAAVLILILIKKEFLCKPLSTEALVLSLLYAFFLVVGKSFRCFEDFSLFKSSINQFLISLLLYLGLSIAIYVFLNYFIQKITDYKRNSKMQDEPHNRFKEHLCILYLLLIWSLFEFAFFPGSVPHDGRRQLMMIDGYRELTTHDGYLGTLLIGQLYNIGRALFPEQYATVFFVIVQNITGAVIFSKVVRYTETVDRLLGKAAFFFYAFVPIWWSFMQCIIKDTLYFCFFTLYVLECFSIYEKPQKLSFLFFFISGVLTCVMRNNGVYVVLPTLLVLILVLHNERDRGRLLITGTLLAAVCILNLLLPKIVGIHQGSVWEMYSVPCQQIARCVVEHGNDLSDDEKTEIDLFFPYEDIEQSYKAGISDPIKNNARIRRPTKEEMTQFWSLWKRL